MASRTAHSDSSKCRAIGIPSVKRQSQLGNFTSQLWEDNRATGKWLTTAGKLVDSEEDANIWSVDDRKRAGRDEDDEGDLAYFYAPMISESLLKTGTAP